MTENPQDPHVPQQPQEPQPTQYGAPAQQPYGTPASQGQGQAGQPGSKFGTHTYTPGAFGQDVAEPKKFGLLKNLTLASLVIYVISAVIGLVTAGNDAIIDATLEETAGQLGVSADQLGDARDMSVAIGMVTSAITLVIALAIYLVVYFGLRKAKNWARILGTVFAAIGTLFTLYGLTGMGVTMSVAPGLGITSLVITVLFLIANIWWLVVAFSKENNAYLRARAGR